MHHNTKSKGDSVARCAKCLPYVRFYLKPPRQRGALPIKVITFANGVRVDRNGRPRSRTYRK